MADATVIYTGTGSLPFPPVTFKSQSDGLSLLFLSASCWGNQAGLIGFDVLIDGQAVARLSVWANQPSTHLVLVPQIVPVTLSYGDHTLTLAPFNGWTIVDANDTFQFVLVY